MTTPENPEEGQNPEDTQEATPKKTTRRTRKPVTSTEKANDADTLKDTQQVNEQMSEQLGGSASPGRHLYQTSQFDVQSQDPNVLRHLAHPSEAAVKAAEASDKILRDRHKDNSDK